MVDSLIDDPKGENEEAREPEGEPEAARTDLPLPRGASEADDEDTAIVSGRARRYTQISEKNRCRFCREKVERVDYKDLLTLQKLCTSQGRLFSRKRSGNCAGHQRMVKKAIKQARFIGLLPYVS